MAVYEVEMKFPLRRTPAGFVEALEAIHAVEEQTVVQKDVYFNHPQRDFVETDEAFRIRSVGDLNRVTYKGPLLDAQTKTRQEIEIPFQTGDETSEKMWTMFRALGFRDVRRIEKTRRVFRATYQEREFKIVLDDVNKLGMFVEIETLAQQSDWEQARDTAVQLAEELDLRDSERRSYLRMLLDQDIFETSSR